MRQVVSEEGLTPFPMDDVTTDAVVLGRTKDGMIFMVMPPMVLGITYMMLTSNHLNDSCHFVDSLAFHMNNEDIYEQKIVSPDIADKVLRNLLVRHNLTKFEEGIFHKGTPEMFDGLYYGEFHPIDLAAVAEVMREIQAALPPQLEAPVVNAILELWVEADKKFVSKEERLAASHPEQGMVS